MKNHDSIKRRTSQPSLLNINRQVEKPVESAPLSYPYGVFDFSKSLIHLVKGQGTLPRNQGTKGLTTST